MTTLRDDLALLTVRRDELLDQVWEVCRDVGDDTTPLSTCDAFDALDELTLDLMDGNPPRQLPSVVVRLLGSTAQAGLLTMLIRQGTP